MTEFLKCGEADCVSKHYAKGLCARHYQMLRRNGKVELKTAANNEPMEFLLSAQNAGAQECALWPFSKNAAGYGQIKYLGRPQLASRVSLLIAGDPPTPKHYACHKPNVCVSPACVNPRHLYWGTQSQNERDKVLEGVSNRGERCGTSVLKEADVHAIRKMKRPGVGAARISKKLNLPRGAVLGVITGKSWLWLK